MEAFLRSPQAWRTVGRQITALLAHNGNRMRLMLAQLILAASCLPYLLLIQLESLTYAFIDPVIAEAVVEGLHLLGFLFFFLVSLPLVSGLLFLAERMEAEETTVLSDLFHAFSVPGAYLQGIRVGAIAVLPILLPVLASQIVTGALSALAADNFLRWTLVALVAVLIAFAVFFALLGWFFTPYTLFRNKGRKLPGAYSNGVRFWGRFLPQILLSVLTLMIYWIAELLPRMLLSYFCICRSYAGALSHDDLTGGYPI